MLCILRQSRCAPGKMIQRTKVKFLLRPVCSVSAVLGEVVDDTQLSRLLYAESFIQRLHTVRSVKPALLICFFWSKVPLKRGYVSSLQGTLSPINHGSWKWPYLKGNYCWRDSFVTSMIMGARVNPRKKQTCCLPENISSKKMEKHLYPNHLINCGYLC